MYATLETYEEHDVGCPKRHVREDFKMLETPEGRRKKRNSVMRKYYNPNKPYEYLFDNRYNRYPFGIDYKSDQDPSRHLFSYPAPGSSTRVLYCDAPPNLWHLCDDDY